MSFGLVFQLKYKITVNTLDTILTQGGHSNLHRILGLAYALKQIYNFSRMVIISAMIEVSIQLMISKEHTAEQRNKCFQN